MCSDLAFLKVNKRLSILQEVCHACVPSRKKMAKVEPTFSSFDVLKGFVMVGAHKMVAGKLE